MKLEWDTLSVQIADELKEKLLHFSEKIEEIMKLDLSNVNKIDLCAIQLLMSLKKGLDEVGSRLLLLNCTIGVMDALTLCGCLELFEYEDE